MGLVFGFCQRRIRGFRATGEARYVPEVTWALGSTKNWKSPQIWPTSYFSGVAKFYVQKNQTSNVRGSMSDMNRIFTGEILPVNFKGENPGGESFPTFPSGGNAHGFCGFHFIRIGLVSICDFPENNISSESIQPMMQLATTFLIIISLPSL